MRLKIRQDGDPCLRTKSENVSQIGPSERMIFPAMFETMYANKGVGLAAPQVGINKRFFVMDITDGEEPMVAVNPEVIKAKGECVIEEGCLSVKNKSVAIKRSKEILLRFYDQDNQKQEKWFKDLAARVCLHEIDHLDGKLILDYADLPDNIEYQKQVHDKNTKKEQL